MKKVDYAAVKQVVNTTASSHMMQETDHVVTITTAEHKREDSGQRARARARAREVLRQQMEGLKRRQEGEMRRARGGGGGGGVLLLLRGHTAALLSHTTPSLT
jgi:hypothetical protein